MKLVGIRKSVWADATSSCYVTLPKFVVEEINLERDGYFIAYVTEDGTVEFIPLTNERAVDRFLGSLRDDEEIFLYVTRYAPKRVSKERLKEEIERIKKEVEEGRDVNK